MPLSNTQHLTATCVVMFIAALGAGYLPTLVKVRFLLSLELASPCTLGHGATALQTAFNKYGTSHPSVRQYKMSYMCCGEVHRLDCCEDTRRNRL